MIKVSKDLTDEEVEYLEKLIVNLHYEKRVDIYSLCSKHNPDAYARTQRKQKIPEPVRWKVWRRDGFICAYCYAEDASLTLDHVIPEEQGGDFSISNLVTACGKCNNKKGNDNVLDFMETEWLKKKRAANSQRTSIMRMLQAEKHLKTLLPLISRPTGVSSS